ncbi:hypothetical protein TNCV_1868571 [Trichonephila clavipes]|nr:hypothetical protein TNCV_1868571 [Trichonephila clavipes]
MEIDGNEKTNFLVKTVAKEKVNSNESITFNASSSLIRLVSINLEELFLVILGHPGGLFRLICLGNIRQLSRAL